MNGPQQINDDPLAFDFDINFNQGIKSVRALCPKKTDRDKESKIEYKSHMVHVEFVHDLL